MSAKQTSTVSIAPEAMSCLSVSSSRLPAMARESSPVVCKTSFVRQMKPLDQALRSRAQPSRVIELPPKGRYRLAEHLGGQEAGCWRTTPMIAVQGVHAPRVRANVPAQDRRRTDGQGCARRRLAAQRCGVRGVACAPTGAVGVYRGPAAPDGAGLNEAFDRQ